MRTTLLLTLILRVGRVRAIRGLIHSGTIIAEASLFAARYHCDAIAEQEAMVAKLPRARVLTQLSDPTSARQLLQELTREVQRARTRAEILALRTVAERLDAWLEINASGLTDKGTWRRLAAELAVSPEALYREIAKKKHDQARG